MRALVLALAALSLCACDKEELSPNYAPVISGNRIALLFDGPRTMEAMAVAIRSSTNHIHLETYIFDQDAVGLAFADLLIERQRAGVQVRIIYDSIGTLGTPQAFFERMRAAGIELHEYNPVNPLRPSSLWAPNHRDHRKILVVDGRVAFTGGMNISSSYANSSMFRSKSRASSRVGWRDTHIRIDGPAVALVQKAFLDTWGSTITVAQGGLDFYPVLEQQGNKKVQVLTSSPDTDQDIYTEYLRAVRSARSSISITSAYFVPADTMLEALCAAAQRGVRVQIVVPGVLESGLVYYASRSMYGPMLACGIHLSQMRTSVLHAKTAIVDNQWSTVGSANMDTRSFLHNSELNVVVLDQEFALALASAFREDLDDSDPIDPAAWAQRKRSDRAFEWMAHWFNYWV